MSVTEMLQRWHTILLFWHTRPGQLALWSSHAVRRPSLGHAASVLRRAMLARAPPVQSHRSDVVERLLARLSEIAFRRSWWIVGAWAVVFLLALPFAGQLTG